MHKQILFLLAGAAVCTALAAASAGAVRTVSKNKTTEHTETKSDGSQPADAQKKRVKAVISGMSSRAQAAVKIDDMDRFLADLASVLTADTGGTEPGTASGDISLLTLVDRQHPLPAGYVPKRLVPLTKNASYTVNRGDLSLRPEAEQALEKLSQAARKDGVQLLASSSYRSFDYQKKVYDKWVQLDGQEEADRESARPGTSQHQLGTVIDFGSISDEFAGTAAGAWMNAHAAEYGWSLSFPQGYEDITGYRWESWHFRYIGPAACRFQEQYFSGIQQYMIEFIAAWNAGNAD